VVVFLARTYKSRNDIHNCFVNNTTGSILALLKKLKLWEAAVNSLASLVINDSVVILLNTSSLHLLICESRPVMVLTEYWVNRVKFHCHIHELSKLSTAILPYQLLNPLAATVRIQVWEEEDFHIRICMKELGKVSSPIRTGYLPKGNSVKSEVFIAGLWVIPY